MVESVASSHDETGSLLDSNLSISSSGNPPAWEVKVRKMVKALVTRLRKRDAGWGQVHRPLGATVIDWTIRLVRRALSDAKQGVGWHIAVRRNPPISNLDGTQVRVRSSVHG